MPDQISNKLILITGVMGSGKTELINLVNDNDLGRTWVADDFVKKLYKDNDKVYKFIQDNFPQAIVENVINREELGKEVFFNKDSLDKLNQFIQPIISEGISNYSQQTKDRVFVELKVYLDYPKHYKGLFSWRIFLFANEAVIRKRIASKFSHLDERSLENIITTNINQQRNILSSKDILEKKNWLFLDNSRSIKDLKKNALYLIEKKLP